MNPGDCWSPPDSGSSVGQSSFPSICGVDVDSSLYQVLCLSQSLGRSLLLLWTDDVTFLPLCGMPPCAEGEMRFEGAPPVGI